MSAWLLVPLAIAFAIVVAVEIQSSRAMRRQEREFMDAWDDAIPKGQECPLCDGWLGSQFIGAATVYRCSKDPERHTWRIRQGETLPRGLPRSGAPRAAQKETA